MSRGSKQGGERRYWRLSSTLASLYVSLLRFVLRLFLSPFFLPRLCCLGWFFFLSRGDFRSDSPAGSDKLLRSWTSRGHGVHLEKGEGHEGMRKGGRSEVAPKPFRVLRFSFFFLLSLFWWRRWRQGGKLFGWREPHITRSGGAKRAGEKKRKDWKMFAPQKDRYRKWIPGEKKTYPFVVVHTPEYLSRWARLSFQPKRV